MCRYLYEGVEEGQRNDDDGKDGSGNEDDNDGGHDGEDCHDEPSQRSRNGLIDGIHVLREPVQDAAEGSGVEERHGRPHDAVQHRVVELFRGEDPTHRQSKGSKEDKESLREAQPSIHTQEHPSVEIETQQGDTV